MKATKTERMIQLITSVIVVVVGISYFLHWLPFQTAKIPMFLALAVNFGVSAWQNYRTTGIGLNFWIFTIVAGFMVYAAFM